MNISVRVEHDTATPAIEALRVGLQPEHLMPYLAETGLRVVQDNLLSLERDRPNRLGAPRAHYFQQAADSVEWHMEGDSAVISIHQAGIAIKYFGGTISAGGGTIGCGPNVGNPTKYLTIPVTPEAYGKRACDIPGLVVLFGRNGPYGIGRRERRSVATQGGGSASTETREVLFVLKPEVEIQPDATILPSATRMTAELKTTFAGYVTLLKEEGMKNGSSGTS